MASTIIRIRVSTYVLIRVATRIFSSLMLLRGVFFISEFIFVIISKMNGINSLTSYELEITKGRFLYLGGKYGF